MFRLVTEPRKLARFTGTERHEVNGRVLLIEQEENGEWVAWHDDDHSQVGVGSTRQEAIDSL